MSEWREIKGFSDYYVDRKGRVLSKKHGKHLVLKPSIDKDGYEIYQMTRNDGKITKYKAHRIVANNFIPNPKNYPIVHHKNSIKNDNRVENLEWTTNAQNIQYAFDEGRIELSPWGIEVYDVVEDRVVAYFNGYQGISEATGLEKVTLYEIVMNNDLLYGGFRLRVDRYKDYSGEELFEANFFNRTISGKNKPVAWKELKFSSLGVFAKFISDLGHGSMMTAKRRLWNSQPIDGCTPKYIPKYEYVTA